MVVIIIIIDKTPNANNDYEVITSFPFASSDVDGDIRTGYLGAEQGDLALILTDVEIPYETFGTSPEEGFKNALNTLNINEQLAKFTLRGTATFSYRFRGIPYRYQFVPYKNKTHRDNYFYNWISGERHVIPLDQEIVPPKNPQKLCRIFDTQSYFSDNIFHLTEHNIETLLDQSIENENILPGYEIENTSESNIQYAIAKAGFGEIGGSLSVKFVKHYEGRGYKNILLAYAANRPPPHFDSILAWELVFETLVPTFSSTPVLIQYREPTKHGYSYSLFSGSSEIGMTAIKIFGPGKYEYGEVINKELPMYTIPFDYDADERIIDPKRVLKDFDKLIQKLWNVEITSSILDDEKNPYRCTRRVFITESNGEEEEEEKRESILRKPKTSMHIHYRLPKHIYVEDYAAYIRLVKKAIRLVREDKGSYLSLWDSTLEVSNLSESIPTKRVFFFAMKKKSYAVYLNGQRYVVNFAQKKDIRDFSSIFFKTKRKVFIDEISTLRLPGAYKFGERRLVPYKEEGKDDEEEFSIFDQIESALCHTNFNRVCSTTGKRLQVSKTDPETQQISPSTIPTTKFFNTDQLYDVSNPNNSEVTEILQKFLLRMNDDGKSNFKKLPGYNRLFVNTNRFCLLCNSIHDGPKKTSITIKNDCVLLKCLKTNTTNFIIKISEL